MVFASPFDEQLAATGPAAVFLRDHKGRWRMEPDWTRDCWGRAPGPHRHAWTPTVCRDRDSGFVFRVLVTSPTLLTEHPRLELRPVATLEEAEAMVEAGW